MSQGGSFEWYLQMKSGYEYSNVKLNHSTKHKASVVISVIALRLRRRKVMLKVNLDFSVVFLAYVYVPLCLITAHSKTYVHLHVHTHYAKILTRNSAIVYLKAESASTIA